jgi:signal peptidase I
MKRALGLILIIVACVAGFLSIRGVMPFMPVFGTSMEPELHAGNLILIEEISPSDVKVGDIIVFTIPAMVREHYNYPVVIAHRVIKVDTEPGLAFRTKGDNTGEDPFTVRAQDLKGKAGQQIPYLGLLLLFFQSQQGIIFIIVALCLFALYLYGSELSRGRRSLQRGIFGPVLDQNQALARRHEQTSQMSSRALEQFASAMSEYARHLASHTSAIQGLSEASQDLRDAVRDQNKMFKSWEHIGKEEKTQATAATPHVVPGCYRGKHVLLPQECKTPGCYRALKQAHQEEN